MGQSNTITWSPRSGRSERGVQIIEFALALPIFFGFIFGLIDLSRVVTGYSTVRSAVAIGARRGAGVERAEWPQVTSLFGNSSEQELTRGRSLAGSPTFVSDAGDSSLTRWYEDQMNVQQLDALYRMELRAIGYANVALANNLGRVRYPCQGTPGCARCFTLRGDPSIQSFFSARGLGESWTVKVIALQCSYDVPISLTSMAFGLLPQFITISSKAYIPVTGYDASFYTP